MGKKREGAKARPCRRSGLEDDCFTCSPGNKNLSVSLGSGQPAVELVKTLMMKDCSILVGECQHISLIGLY